jgi:transcriptional regulator with XRE-family HTH domain
MKQADDGTSSKNGFSKWLEQRCLEECLSLRKLAARAGVSHATVAEVKKSGRPSAATIKKLAAAFSNDGPNQRAALEDYLFTLCGFRSQPPEIKLSEPLARLVDKMSHYDEEKLQLVEQFADYISRLDEPTIYLKDGECLRPLTDDEVNALGR